MCFKSQPLFKQLSYLKSQASAKRKSGLFPAGCARNTHVFPWSLDQNPHQQQQQQQLYSDSSITHQPAEETHDGHPWPFTHDPRWERGQRSTNTHEELSPPAQLPFGTTVQKNEDKTAPAASVLGLISHLTSVQEPKVLELDITQRKMHWKAHLREELSFVGKASLAVEQLFWWLWCCSTPPWKWRKILSATAKESIYKS